PAGAFGAVEFRHQVVQFGVIGQRLEAVREAARDVEHAAAGGAQLGGRPAGEGRRAGPQVHDDVVGGPESAADQLVLAERLGLVVHAAQGAGPAVEGDVGLHPVGNDAVGGELLAAPAAGEEAAL